MKTFINKKDKKLYYSLGLIINKTKAQNHQMMAMYIPKENCGPSGSRQCYAMKLSEFSEEFEEVLNEKF